MKIKLNTNVCEAHGVCVRECAEMFRLEDDMLKLTSSTVPDDLLEKVQSAVDHCPRQALSLQSTT